MKEDRYAFERKRIDERIDLAIIGMRTALNYINFQEKNKERAKNAISVIITKILQAETYKEKISKKNLLSKKLKNEKGTTSVLPSEIARQLEELIRNNKYRVRWVNERASYGSNRDNYETLYRIGKTISENPVYALLSFASDYTNAVYQREQLEERIKREALEEATTREAERKRQAEEIKRQRGYEEVKIQDTTYRTPTPGPRRAPAPYSYPRDVTMSTPPRIRETEYVSVEYIQGQIDKELAQGSEYMDYDLRYKIRKKYQQEDGINYYGDFYSPDNVADMYRFYVLTGKTEFYSGANRYSKIIEMGQMAVDIIYKDLENGSRYKTTKLAQFMEQFEPHKALERYAKARENYMRFYNHLGSKEKEKVDRAAQNEEKYREMFGIYGSTGKDIATVEDIKKVVNKKVKDLYLKEHEYDKYISRNGEYNDEYDFYYSLQYMSIDEIASLYKMVVYDKGERERRYSIGNVDQNVIDHRNKEREKLQILFAKAIRRRLTNLISLKTDATEEEKQRYYEQYEKDLVAICRDVFGEEPLFKTSYVNTEIIEPNYGKDRVETAEVISSAKRRYYGMGKLEKVIATMNFKKLQRLSKKDTLTAEEQAEVRKLF